jgi:hypothetical protein
MYKLKKDFTNTISEFQIEKLADLDDKDRIK